MKAPSSSQQFAQKFSAIALGGDTLCIIIGLLLGYWLRYNTALGSMFIEVTDARFTDYIPLICVGTAFLIGGFVHLNLYDSRLLLRRYQAMGIILKGTAFWFFTYLGVSLTLKFNPPISRIFVLIACVAILLILYVWRTILYLIATNPRNCSRLQQRVAILGWSAEANTLVADIKATRAHPLQLVGMIRTNSGTTTPPFATAHTAPPTIPILGSHEQLGKLLSDHSIHVLLAARLDLPRNELARLAAVCENTYVELKIIPSVFQIFISGLRLQTFGRVPVLGVDELAINGLFNRALKRTIDICGAVVGLTISAPVMLALAVLIRRESKGAPILFRQERIGAGHKPFMMLKLRSMVPDAPSSDHENVSTIKADPRLLRIGPWMRRWNLDELPQFWNVLKGQMSLIGPRPERTHHVDMLAGTIPHYLPRHLTKPGMTGWAQVNNLRGSTDLESRIQHDIYYIENWSLWLDFQILLLTFARWKNTAE